MDVSASVMDQYMTSVYQLSFQCFSDRQTHGRTDLRTSPLRRTHLKIVKPRQKHIFKHKQHSHRKCTDPVSRYCLPAACSYLSLTYRVLRSQHENFFLPLHFFFCCCLSLALPLFVSFLLHRANSHFFQMHPRIRGSFRLYFFMSVTISGKPAKSAQNNLKIQQLFTKPLRTHLFARPGLFPLFLVACTRL